MILNANERDPMLVESPVALVAGVTTTIAIRYWGTPSAGSVTIKRILPDGESADLSATLFPAGTITYGSSTMTLKPMTALTGGYTYILRPYATVGGDVTVKKCYFNVQT